MTDKKPQGGNRYFRPWKEIKSDFQSRREKSARFWTWRCEIMFLFILFAGFIALEQCAFFNRSGELHTESANPVILQLTRHVSDGDPVAMTDLAFHYRLGEHGLRKDRCAALFWHDKSARSGEWRSQIQLSRAYAVGDGIQQDETLAYYWLRSALGLMPSPGQQENRLLAALEGSLTPEQKSGAKEFRPADQPPLEIHDYMSPGLLSREFSFFTGADTCRR